MHVLICDDDRVSVRIIQSMLNSISVFSTALAYNASEARQKLAVANFDLVILDLHMPEGNGDELLGYIRGTIKSSVPVLVVTADGYDLVKQRIIEAGADGCIAKPITQRGFSKVVKSLLSI